LSVTTCGLSPAISELMVSTSPKPFAPVVDGNGIVFGVTVIVAVAWAATVPLAGERVNGAFAPFAREVM
jgi:hypothetical protein